MAETAVGKEHIFARACAGVHWHTGNLCRHRMNGCIHMPLTGMLQPVSHRGSLAHHPLERTSQLQYRQCDPACARCKMGEEHVSVDGVDVVNRLVAAGFQGKLRMIVVDMIQKRITGDTSAVAALKSELHDLHDRVIQATEIIHRTISHIAERDISAKKLRSVTPPNHLYLWCFDMISSKPLYFCVFSHKRTIFLYFLKCFCKT